MVSQGMEAYIEHFQMRVIQDAIASAHADQLIHRAEQFEAARPKAGDYFGQATREELSRQWRELTAIAQAFRAKAAIVGATSSSLVEELVVEVAA